MFLSLESYDEFSDRIHCPIDCEIVEYKTKVTEARFIHDPPKGIEPILITNDVVERNVSSHILKLYQNMTRDELDKYIE